MSTLSNLLRQVREKDAQLATDLEREVKALEKRRAFGLNFERHAPEAVELPGRKVRRGDKVRILPARQPTADSRQPTADSRQPTADSRQPTADKNLTSACGKLQALNVKTRVELLN